MAKKTRLDKFLCDSLNMTRKEAKESVKKGKVVVNGEAIKKPEYKVDAEQDQVEFDHKLIQFEQFHYLMLHKPQGVVSATKDHHDQTVLDLIHEDYKDRLFPVGRLDKDTEGLLLLTDDGMLAHELLSPRKQYILQKFQGSLAKMRSPDSKKVWILAMAKNQNKQDFRSLKQMYKNQRF